MKNKNLLPENAKTTKELIDSVKSLGYTEKRKNGSSHMIFECKGMPTLSIPDHKTLSPGTKRNIVKLVKGESYYSK